jgi:hypothetical protein
LENKRIVDHAARTGITNRAHFITTLFAATSRVDLAGCQDAAADTLGKIAA